MSQTDFLRSTDAEIVAAFADLGLADAAIYDAGSPLVSCTVYVDRGVAVFGDDAAGVAGERTVITFQRAEVLTPVRGAEVRILDEVGGAVTETFELAELWQQDESVSRWIVSHG